MTSAPCKGRLQPHAACPASLSLAANLQSVPSSFSGALALLAPLLIPGGLRVGRARRGQWRTDPFVDGLSTRCAVVGVQCPGDEDQLGPGGGGEENWEQPLRKLVQREGLGAKPVTGSHC